MILKSYRIFVFRKVIKKRWGYYWSSSASATDIARASSTFFKSGGGPSENKNANRYTGLPLRPFSPNSPSGI